MKNWRIILALTVLTLVAFGCQMVEQGAKGLRQDIHNLTKAPEAQVGR